MNCFKDFILGLKLKAWNLRDARFQEFKVISISLKCFRANFLFEARILDLVLKLVVRSKCQQPNIQYSLKKIRSMILYFSDCLILSF